MALFSNNKFLRLLTLSYACLLTLPCFSQQSPRLSVTWNPNIETYFILERIAVERLGNYGYITRETNNAHQPMVKAAFEKFGSYKDSAIGIKAAALLDTLRKIHVFNDMILEALLYTRAFPDTGYRYPLNQAPNNPQREAALRLIQPFFREMQQFYVSAGAGEFLQRHRAFYDGAVHEVAKDIPPGIDRYMEHYYGEKVPAFTVIVNPTMPIAPVEGDFRGVGPSVITDKGKIPFMIMSTSIMLSPLPSLSQYKKFGFDNPAHTVFLTVHEFGHSFVNPHLAPNQEQLEKYSALFTDSLQKVMNAQDIYSWYSCVIEHIVRLGEIRIAEYMKDHTRAQSLRKLHTGDCHFVFIPAMEEKMKVYEQHRQRYPTFNDFLPELLTVFKNFTPAQVNQLATTPGKY
ncbi:DUF4932 domain-containing protein [Chitinophaga arvensicola]|uniref:DUF4932 domain-containing protein n=1 Tax=Chitinophaga arvensicola TaxID=29529 RepID=A0A1I0R8F4_9BACT|nr:DUF4932 domain-containing protein [Chitinophaga arvensicola]SEW37070.1 protein of unknown function [Chitinophaga arvensicola]